MKRRARTYKASHSQPTGQSEAGAGEQSQQGEGSRVCEASKAQGVGVSRSQQGEGIRGEDRFAYSFYYLIGKNL